jgi:hypothetical protein
MFMLGEVEYRWDDLDESFRSGMDLDADESIKRVEGSRKDYVTMAVATQKNRRVGDDGDVESERIGLSSNAATRPASNTGVLGNTSLVGFGTSAQDVPMGMKRKAVDASPISSGGSSTAKIASKPVGPKSASDDHTERPKKRRKPLLPTHEMPMNPATAAANTAGKGSPSNFKSGFSDLHHRETAVQHLNRKNRPRTLPVADMGSPKLHVKDSGSILRRISVASATAPIVVKRSPSKLADAKPTGRGVGRGIGRSKKRASNIIQSLLLTPKKSGTPIWSISPAHQKAPSNPLDNFLAPRSLKHDEDQAEDEGDRLAPASDLGGLGLEDGPLGTELSSKVPELHHQFKATKGFDFSNLLSEHDMPNFDDAGYNALDFLYADPIGHEAKQTQSLNQSNANREERESTWFLDDLDDDVVREQMNQSFLRRQSQPCPFESSMPDKTDPYEDLVEQLTSEFEGVHHDISYQRTNSKLAFANDGRDDPHARLKLLEMELESELDFENILPDASFSHDSSLRQIPHKNNSGGTGQTRLNIKGKSPLKSTVLAARHQIYQNLSASSAGLFEAPFAGMLGFDSLLGASEQAASFLLDQNLLSTSESLATNKPPPKKRGRPTKPKVPKPPKIPKEKKEPAKPGAPTPRIRTEPVPILPAIYTPGSSTPLPAPPSNIARSRGRPRKNDPQVPKKSKKGNVVCKFLLIRMLTLTLHWLFIIYKGAPTIGTPLSVAEVSSPAEVENATANIAQNEWSPLNVHLSDALVLKHQSQTMLPKDMPVAPTNSVKPKISPMKRKTAMSMWPLPSDEVIDLTHGHDMKPFGNRPKADAALTEIPTHSQSHIPLRPKGNELDQQRHKLQTIFLQSESIQRAYSTLRHVKDEKKYDLGTFTAIGLAAIDSGSENRDPITSLAATTSMTTKRKRTVTSQLSDITTELSTTQSNLGAIAVEKKPKASQPHVPKKAAKREIVGENQHNRQQHNAHGHHHSEQVQTQQHDQAAPKRTRRNDRDLAAALSGRRHPLCSVRL